ncbi:MAG: hypothetical protein KAR06_04765 [Deltaproteobacteria bacterium]|nr:hypothetical protein [Deltaproteobacteria bacterium]
MSFPYTFPIVFGSWPSMTVAIDSEIQDIRKHSISVDTRIEERSTARFDVVDTSGVLSFDRGTPLTIYAIGGALIFGGFVDAAEKIQMSPAGGLYHKIKCMDYHYLADKRLVAESYEDKTCGFIVQDIFDTYLDPEGVAVGTIEAGPTLVEAIFNYVRVTDAFDSLAEKAGKIWYIDESKVIYFVDRTTASAPWNATSSDFIKGGTKLSNKNPQYRNRQYIRGGRDTTDQQTENFTGDGVTVAFTVGYPIVKVPTVEVDSVGQTVGIKGLDTAKDCYWSKGDATIIFDTAPPNADDVEIVYYGQFDVLIVVEDTVEIADQLAIEGSGTGIVEDMDDEPALNDKDAALDSGIAKVERYGLASQRLTYRTTRLGLKPGQTQTITYTPYGITALDMLIEAVKIQGFGPEMINTITAVVGPDIGSWAKYFGTVSGFKDKIMDRLNVGSAQILIILVARSEIWEWEESITENVFACTVPNSTPCGGATPVVC